MTSENIWSRLNTARKISSNLYIIATCLSDILYRYSRNSSIFDNLSQALFSSSIDQIKLLNDYSNILQNILKQNSLHTNIIQNIRRLFRTDSCLKELFSTIVDEYCQCHECDCTILNSIDDVIHDINEIQLRLLIESSQLSCICFRCSDKNQLKTVTFKKFSPCLALTVNRLHINAKDQLINTQGIIYDLIYIIEFDQTLCSILNVYQQQDIEFVIVDGINVSNRRSTIDSQGKFLTLWMSQKTCSHNEIQVPLSPSIASSSQIIPQSIVDNDSSNICDNLPSTDENQSDNLSSSPATTVSEGLSDNDTLTDIYLTLLHSMNKNHSEIEHDHRINSLSSSTLLSMNDNKQHNEEISSSISNSTNRSLKQLSSTMKSKRTHPYTTA
ncbi:unnamed protein product [Rotaria sp. Silwood1]|nr:unnamed protein product [Rotaria sp. Silwood1]CAF1419345.1 unnamed protein product [Rotaria sp. Silwood1]CAF3629968.1 unnamed protein product [Rotaria sp. Silwood1]CAF4633701.1 unnamed protein product [Rotaria sp. Silwood1]